MNLGRFTIEGDFGPPKFGLVISIILTTTILHIITPHITLFQTTIPLLHPQLHMHLAIHNTLTLKHLNHLYLPTQMIVQTNRRLTKLETNMQPLTLLWIHCTLVTTPSLLHLLTLLFHHLKHLNHLYLPIQMIVQTNRRLTKLETKMQPLTLLSIHCTLVTTLSLLHLLTPLFRHLNITPQMWLIQSVSISHITTRSLYLLPINQVRSLCDLLGSLQKRWAWKWTRFDGSGPLSLIET